MEIALFIFTITALIMLCIAYIIDEDIRIFARYCSVFLILLAIYSGVKIFSNEKELTPLEVHRGNITLEITYRDGIAIDSTVVGKEEVK